MKCVQDRKHLWKRPEQYFQTYGHGQSNGQSRKRVRYHDGIFYNEVAIYSLINLKKKIDWTHAPEAIGALILRLWPLGHPVLLYDCNRIGVQDHNRRFKLILEFGLSKGEPVSFSPTRLIIFSSMQIG